jgi:hypothetical protein
MKQKRFFHSIYLIISLLSAAQSAVAQQAWTRPQGGWYAQVGVSALQANSLINGTDELIPLGREVRDLTLQAYGEYGLTNRLTLSAQVPLKMMSVQNQGNASATPAEGSMVALSNLQATLTANFFQKNGWVVSGKTSVQLPTARFESATGLRSGFDAWSIMPSVAAGIGRSRFFASAEGGYAFRTNGYSNRVFGAAQVGTYFGKRQQWLPIVGLEMMKSGSDGTYDDGTSATTGLYLEGQSYLSPSLKIGYRANRNMYLWLSAGGGMGTITREIIASPGVSFSISYQR